MLEYSVQSPVGCVFLHPAGKQNPQSHQSGSALVVSITVFLITKASGKTFLRNRREGEEFNSLLLWSTELPFL